MNAMRCLCAVAMFALAVPATTAQDTPKPGPEHEILNKMVGTWDMTMKFAGMESKGTVVYKLDLGGLWLSGTTECELMGQKFSGRSYDCFDSAKKKYVGVWIDSMSTTPMTMEGTYDKPTKTLTMAGEGPGMDGKPAKYKAVSVMPDDNTINFSMYMGDAKEPAFTIAYKRKK